jgi:hypothetical protein
MKFLILLTIFTCSIFQLFGQEWFHVTSGIPEPSIAFDDHYGKSNTMEGNVAVIGAPQNDESNLNSGKVFIYEKIEGNWELVEELFSETSGQGEYFGTVVLLKDGFLFVSAPGLDVNGLEFAGGVLVYKKIDAAWTYLTTIIANDAHAYAQLGTSIAFNGNILAVGAAYSNSGEVYVFNDPASSFSQVTKIVLDPAEIPDRFGISVALNSTELFIGDSNCGQGSNQGAVFVYDLVNFNRSAKLVSSPESNFNFALSLSATETELAVGSPFITNADFSYGAVFLYEKPAGGWVNGIEDVQLSPVLSDDYGAYGQSVLLSDTSLIVGSDGGIALDFYDKPEDGWSPTAVKFTIRETELTYVHRYAYSFATNGTDLFVGAYNLNTPQESSGAVYTYKKTSILWSSIEPVKILAEPTLSSSDSFFGYDVDINGDYAVVGSPQDDGSGNDAGAAYVYKLTGSSWQRIAKLTASDGIPGDRFGSSVAISGEMIVVSAENADVNPNDGNYVTGRVYVFRKPSGNEWSDSHESEIIPRIDLKRGAFGHRVDVEGNLVAISHFREGSSDEIGNVYLVEKNGSTWELRAKMSPSPNTVRLFGNEICLADNLLTVSGVFVGYYPGTVLLYEKPVTGWVNATQSAILRPSDPIVIDNFGRSVAIDNNTILIGASQVSPAGFSGAAYIFEKSGDHWINATETSKLLSEGEVAGSRFGSAVALSGNYAAVGSSTVNSGNGKVLLFRKIADQWETSPYTSLEMSSSGGTNQFGYSMAMEDDHLIVGARGASTLNGISSGSAEFYIKPPTVTHVTSSTADGTYKIDDLINIKVTFSHPVVVTGNPIIQIALDNSVVQTAQFKNISNGNEINFEYKVQENDFSDDLDYTTVNALALPAESSIKSGIINQDSYNTLPVPGSLNSLGASKSIVINGEYIVGIPEDPSSDIEVYPNPFKEYIRVSGSDIRSIELFSTNGTSFLTSSQNFSEVITPNLTSGIYILKITTGKSLIFRKILKH